jgi:Big-like domain-containing protein
VKLIRLTFCRVCRLSLAGICLLPLIAYCQSVGDAQDSAPAFLKSIAVTPRVSSIVTGATQQFTAIGIYSDGHKKNITSSVTWNSSAKNVATITSGGLATGVAAGQSKITAILLSIRGAARLTVTPELISIAVGPAGATMVVGQSLQFQAIGTFSDGSIKDITSSVGWSSSATNIVSISGTGLANALIGGVPPGGPPVEVTITATLGSVSGSTTLTVTDSLTSIAVSPSSITLNVGAQQTFTATGSYQDGTTSDITALVVWSSSNTNVLTIVASGTGAGTATAVAVGTVTVTATENGINGTATATVTKAPPPPGAITPSFFGMTIGDTAPYPPSTVPIGAIGHPTMLAWATIEPKKGVYDFSFYDQFADWSSSHNVPLMVTFGWTPSWALSDKKTCKGNACSAYPDDPQDWVDFITAVVNHYNGVDAPNIQYYELWDEANDGTFWSGRLDQLVALAQAAYPIIHQNPNSLLLTPSTSRGRIEAHDWMIAYLQAGGAQYADGGTFHGYLAPQGGSPPYPFPEDSDVSGYGDIVSRAATFRLLFDLYGLQGKPMFDTEGSWGKAQITDPNQQAAWLARWYLLQAGAGTVQSAYWLAWGNSTPSKPIDEQWGLITDYYDQITPTAAGIAYGQVYDWLVDAAISPCTSSANVWTCALIRSRNYQGLAVWFYSANETDTTSYTPDDPHQFVQYRDLAGNVTPVNGDITIGPQPILLESGPPP